MANRNCDIAKTAFSQNCFLAKTAFSQNRQSVTNKFFKSICNSQTGKSVSILEQSAFGITHDSFLSFENPQNSMVCPRKDGRLAMRTKKRDRGTTILKHSSLFRKIRSLAQTIISEFVTANSRSQNQLFARTKRQLRYF